MTKVRTNLNMTLEGRRCLDMLYSALRLFEGHRLPVSAALAEVGILPAGADVEAHAKKVLPASRGEVLDIAAGVMLRVAEGHAQVLSGRTLAGLLVEVMGRLVAALEADGRLLEMDDDALQSAMEGALRSVLDDGTPEADCRWSSVADRYAGQEAMH